jgi:hypothetical protein
LSYVTSENIKPPIHKKLQTRTSHHFSGGKTDAKLWTLKVPKTQKPLCLCEKTVGSGVNVLGFESHGVHDNCLRTWLFKIIYSTAERRIIIIWNQCTSTITGIKALTAIWVMNWIFIDKSICIMLQHNKIFHRTRI